MKDKKKKRILKSKRIGEGLKKESLKKKSEDKILDNIGLESKRMMGILKESN